MEIHLHINGKKIGPLSIYEVRESLRSGKINADCMAWIKGMEEWKPLRDCDPFMESVEVTLADASHETIIVTEKERDTIDQAYSTETVYGPRPWIRLWARVIDFPILILPGLLFLRAWLGEDKLNAYMGPEALQNLLEQNQTSQPSISTLITITSAICISWVITETLILSCFSTTLGKWILNTKISDAKGKKINPKSALLRSFNVCFRGCGLIIFPFVFICPIISYFSLTKRNTTSWDYSQETKVNHGDLSALRIMGAVLMILITQNIFGLLFSSLESPVNTSP
ncbi:MAG: DUF4339 domain-containing protein [Verrucomicrobiales bacterium]|nr:DUF4339 domain-containing protein [Verrucomicrobiales bacterium]